MNIHIEIKQGRIKLVQPHKINSFNFTVLKINTHNTVLTAALTLISFQNRNPNQNNYRILISGTTSEEKHLCSGNRED